MDGSIQVLDLIEEQTAKIDQPLHALLLVGGFSGAPAASFRIGWL